jgi:hypothetical protein
LIRLGNTKHIEHIEPTTNKTKCFRMKSWISMNDKIKAATASPLKLEARSIISSMASTHDAASPLKLRSAKQHLRYGFDARCEKDRSEKAAPVKNNEA